MITFRQFLAEVNPLWSTGSFGTDSDDVALQSLTLSILLGQNGQYYIPVLHEMVDNWRDERTGAYHITNIQGLIKLISLQHKKTNAVAVSFDPNVYRIVGGVTQGRGGVLCYLRGRLLMRLPFDARTVVSKETGDRWIDLKLVVEKGPKFGLGRFIPKLQSIITKIDDVRAELASKVASEFSESGLFVDWKEVADAYHKQGVDAANIEGREFRAAVKDDPFSGRIIDYNTIPHNAKLRNTYWPYFARPIVRQQTENNKYIPVAKWLEKHLTSAIEDIILDNDEVLHDLFFNVVAPPKDHRGENDEFDEALMVDFEIDKRLLIAGRNAPVEFEAENKPGGKLHGLGFNNYLARAKPGDRLATIKSTSSLKAGTNIYPIVRFKKAVTQNSTEKWYTSV